MPATKIYLRVAVFWSRASIGAVLFALLTLTLCNSKFDASLGASAYAQSSPVRQFAVTVEKRKVVSGPDVVRVSQGDSVQIVLTADEAAEVHLHGYDLLLSLQPNVPGKLEFNAKIAGRFPLEAHRYGPGEPASHHRGGQPLLYVEVHPR
jgi:plastocyanin